MTHDTIAKYMLDQAGWSRSLQARELLAAYHELDDLEIKLFFFWPLQFLGRKLKFKWSSLRKRRAEVRSTIQFLGGKL